MKKILLILTILIHYSSYAQVVPVHKELYDCNKLNQSWVKTQNAAGLTRDTLIEQGIAYFQLEKSDGSYYLVQDGDSYNKLLFVSESFKKIGKYLYGYGKVSFDMGRMFNRSWSDVYRSHNSNPYFSGSSIKGKYDTQNFNLSASLASIDINGFTYGMKLDYNVGDLSRLKDPRSRANLADYRIVPSFTYSFGKHVLGLDAGYHRRKEKIPSITTVQTDPNMKYYILTGMEYVNGVVGGYSGFKRQFVHHEFEGGLSYSYNNNLWNSVNSLIMKKGHEDVTGDMKYMPGKYHTSVIGFSSFNRFTAGKLLHTLDFNISMEDSYADEYVQEKITEKDPVTGIESSYWNTLIIYKKRYKVNVSDLSLDYNIHWLDNQRKERLAFVGVNLDYKNVNNEFTLPYSSLKYSYLDAALNGGGTIWKKGLSSLNVEANVGYIVSLDASIKLTDNSTDYAQQVLLPDMQFYSASVMHGDLSVQYSFPIKLKDTRSQLFVKMFGGYLSTNKDTDRYNVSLSFGIYY